VNFGSGIYKLLKELIHTRLQSNDHLVTWLKPGVNEIDPTRTYLLVFPEVVKVR